MHSNRSLIGRMLAINSLSDRNLKVMALANTGITSLVSSGHSLICIFCFLFGLVLLNPRTSEVSERKRRIESLESVKLGNYMPLFCERSSICFCIFPFPACLDSGRVMAQLFFQSLFSLQFASTSLWLVFWFNTKKTKKKFGLILPVSFPPAIFCLSCDAGILLAKSTVCAFDTKRRYKSPRNFEFREIQNFDAKQVKNSGFRVDLVDKTRAA